MPDVKMSNIRCLPICTPAPTRIYWLAWEAAYVDACANTDRKFHIPTDRASLCVHPLIVRVTRDEPTSLYT